MKTYKTPNGKEIIPYYEGQHLRVKFGGGGELPEILSGLFTNFTVLDNAINKYIDNFRPAKFKDKPEQG